MLSKFIILALTEESLAVILEESTGSSSGSSGYYSAGSSAGSSADSSADSSEDDTEAGKTAIAWSCQANVCRSAGAHIFSTLITQCFNAYNKFDIHSFGADEGKKENTKGGREYNKPASPTLLEALKTNKKVYLELAKKQLGSVELTTAEEDCWNEKIDTIAKNFRSTAPTDKVMCKKDITVYAASAGVMASIKKTEAYKTCEEKGGAPDIELMKEGGIGDEGWHASALAERLTFTKLLKAYPGHYENKLPPFNTGTGIANEDLLYIYAPRSDGEPPKGINAGPYADAGQKKKKSDLTEADIGFLWHDLVVPNVSGAGFEIAEEFKNIIDTLGKRVTWNIGGAEMKDGVYTRALFVRPGFFNYDGLTQWLKSEGESSLADELLADKTEISFSAYDSLAKTLVEAVFDKFHKHAPLKSWNRHQHTIM